MKAERLADEPRPLCPQAAEAAPYLQGLLSGAGREQFDAHLSACPACRAAVAELRPVVQKIRDLPPPPARDLAARIMAQIPREEWTSAKARADHRRFTSPGLLRLAAVSMPLRSPSSR